VLEKRRRLGIGGGVRKHARDEARPSAFAYAQKRSAVQKRLPSKRWANQPLPHRDQVPRIDLQRRAIVERQGRLRQHRRQHRRLQHHRQCEVAGETHPHRAHTRPAALLVCEPRQVRATRA
jgi:hypothetical protein